jgi:hypothetical protein
MEKAEAKYQGKDPRTWAEYAWRMGGAGRLRFEQGKVTHTNPAFTEHIVAGFLEGLLDMDVEVGEGAENVYVFKLKPRS